MKIRSSRQLLILVLTLAVVVVVSYEFAKPAKATTTHWYKVAPNTCSLTPHDVWTSSGGTSRQDSEYDEWSGLATASLTEALTIEAYCPVFLPDDATITYFRLRTMRVGGLPASDDAKGYLRKHRYSGTETTVATVDMDASDNTADASGLSEAVDNYNCAYFIKVYIYKANSATVPQIDLVELQYTTP